MPITSITKLNQMVNKNSFALISDSLSRKNKPMIPDIKIKKIE